MKPEEPDRQLLEIVRTHYWESRDFNGIRLDMLASAMALSQEDIKQQLAGGLESGHLQIASTAWQSNPAILAATAPIQLQLETLVETTDLLTVYVYPTMILTNGHEYIDSLSKRPFTQALALGLPQLVPLFFSTDILEKYWDDGRFSVRYWDFGGRIYVKDKWYDRLAPDEHMSLRFGMGLTESGEKVVSAFAWDLHKLPPRQQRILAESQISEPCSLDEAYFQTQILAELPNEVSAYDLTTVIQADINTLFESITGQPLFKNDYSVDNRPRKFGPFMRPTSAAFNGFVMDLDVVMSENLNPRAFKGIPTSRKGHDTNGELVVQPIGTIHRLESWLQKEFPADASQPTINKIAEGFKQIRNARAKPAHRTNEPDYDPVFYDKQEKLIRSGCDTAQALYELLRQHPLAPKNIETVGGNRPIRYR